MAVGLLDMNGRLIKTFATTIDIRKWQPGDFDEVVLLSVDVPPGEYDLAVGIIDPWTSKPSIQFANHLSIVDGWSVLSKVNVTPKKQ